MKNDDQLRDIARLMDVEDSVFPEEAAIDASIPDDSDDELKDERALEDEALAKIQAQWPENPMIKTLFTIGTTLLIALILVPVGNKFFGLSPTATEEPASPVAQTSESPRLPAVSLAEREPVSAKIKAEKVTASLKQAKETPAKEEKQPASLSVDDTPPSPAASLPAPTPAVKAPPPVKVPQPRPPVRLRRKAYASRPSFPPAVVPKRAAPSQPSQQANPEAQIQAMASLGEYRGDATPEPKPDAGRQKRLVERRVDTPMAAFPPVPEFRSDIHALEVGTSIRAKTVLPVILDGRGEQKLLLQTTEALGPLPAGAYLLANIAHQNEAIQATVTGYIEDNQVTPIAGGAIAVLGDNRLPVMAVRHQGESGGFDIGSMLLGSVGQALKQQNLPEITSSISNGTSSITQISGDSSFLSGLVEGMVDEITDQLDSQQQQRSARHSFWYLPANTDIHLFVHYPVKL